MKETLDKMDFYLDINHEGIEIVNIIDEVHRRNKPIFLLLIIPVMIPVEEWRIFIS